MADYVWAVAVFMSVAIIATERWPGFPWHGIALAVIVSSLIRSLFLRWERWHRDHT